MIVLFFWIVFFTMLGALVGKTRGRTWDGVWLGLFLGPIGILILFLLQNHCYTCSLCAEQVQPAAVVCPHCGADLDDDD